jgi:tRNA threonylcarbamoyladenosine biosynthesis protein TsaE
VIFLSRSVKQTEAVAAQLAALLAPGVCLALNGDLGTGKTQFVRGLVRALGGNARLVHSPTFVLLNIYDTPRCPVYHLDAYRVSGPEDFAAIGFSELLEQPGIIAVEWADRVRTLLPQYAVEIALTTVGKTRRQVEIRMPGGTGP